MSDFYRQDLERLLRDWAGQLGSCVLYFSCPTDTSLTTGAGVVPFARLFAFLPSRRPPHSVRGHGLGNRAAKQRHGTVGFSCSFFLSSCRRPPQLRAGGRLGQSSYSHSGTGLHVLSSLLCDARYFVFSLLCVFGEALPPLAGLWVVPPFHFVLVFAFCLAPPATMVASGRVLTWFSLSSRLCSPSIRLSSSRPPPRRRYAGGF